MDDYFFLDKCRRWAHEIQQSSTDT
jgi:hypothetical protein